MQQNRRGTMVGWLTSGVLLSMLGLLALFFILMRGGDSSETVTPTPNPTLVIFVGEAASATPTTPPSPTPPPTIPPSATPPPPTLTPDLAPSPIMRVNEVEQTQIEQTQPEPEFQTVELPLTARCLLAANLAAEINVRAEPSLSADVVNFLWRDRAYEAVAMVTDRYNERWFYVQGGWVKEVVVNAQGASCHSLPRRPPQQFAGGGDASAPPARITAAELQITEGMLEFDMIVFFDGRVWYNPNR